MIDDIPEYRLKEFRDAFEMFDRDKDGTIKVKELGNVMRTLNVDFTEQELNEMIQEADANKNGSLEFEEFVHLMNKRNKETDKEEEVINAFRVFDKDGDGVISTADLVHYLTTLGDILTDEEVEEMIKEADIDGNGNINYEEFVRLMMIK